MAPDRRGRDEPGLDPARAGRWAAGSTGSTASSAPRRTSGTPTWCTTTTRSTSPAAPRRATTSASTSPTAPSSSSTTCRSDRPRPSVLPLLRAGAAHAPHHVPREWADRYRGRFDAGYEVAREEILARQKKLGIVPENTELPPINPHRRPGVRHGTGREAVPRAGLHQAVGRPERRTSAASSPGWPRCTPGSSPHADAQIGRVLDHLEEIEELDNTIDRPGVRQRRERRGRTQRVGQREQDGQRAPRRPRSEPRDARRARWADGPTTTTPTAGRWPSTRPSRCGSATRSTAAARTPASSRGRPGSALAARSATSTTTRSTSCRRSWTVSASTEPETVKGVTQIPVQGVSMRYSFDAPSLPSARTTQFYSMLGTRGIWHQGWKAVTTHPAISGWSHFEQDTWELYHTDDGPRRAPRPRRRASRAAHRADRAVVLRGRRQPRLPARRPWSRRDHPTSPRPQLVPPRDRYVYRPRSAEVPESVAANTRNRSFTIGALVDLPGPGAPGRAVRPRQPLRRPRAVRPGRPAATTSTTSSASPSSASWPPRGCRPADS